MVLNKRICNLHKVSVILKDKFPTGPWDIKGLKISKDLLTSNEALPRPVDDDTATTFRKSKKGKAATSDQSEAQEEQAGAKRRMDSKDLSKRPKWLRQTKLIFELHDDTSVEE